MRFLEGQRREAEKFTSFFILNEGRRIMKRWYMSAVTGLAIAGMASAIAAARVHEVGLYIEEVEGRPVPEFYFEPVGLFIQPGDTVEFKAYTPHHTATAYHPAQGKVQRVPDGVEPFSSPMIPVGQSWSYTFTIPGVYDIWCGPHESYGMAMRIVVGTVAGPGAEPSKDFSPIGTFGAAGAVLNSAPLLPGNIVNKGAISWKEIPAAAKQAPAAH